MWRLHGFIDYDSDTGRPVATWPAPGVWPVPVTGEALRKHCGCGCELSWDDARKWLSEWDTRGFLRVLRDPQTAGKEICIELRYYINNKGCRPEFRKDLVEHALANGDYWAQVRSLCE
jgi:hypothetical protein